MTFQFFEVGGCVRDHLLGIESKDVDFAVVAPSGAFQNAQIAFFALSRYLKENDFHVFLETPKFLTIRARVPKNHPLSARTSVADFVLARKDGPSSDGRRPDFVLPGTLMDDLSRRDFTMNAIARDVEGNFIDPFGGVDDVANSIIRFVGDPVQRISEDGLRVVRALRFSITKNFEFHQDTWDAVNSDFAASMILSVSPERIREELNKMFAQDTVGSLNLLGVLNQTLVQNLFRGGLNLQATLAKLG